MGFPRQEYWSGLSFPSPGDLPDPGTEPSSPAWQVDSFPLSHLEGPLLKHRLLFLKPFCIYNLFPLLMPFVSFRLGLALITNTPWSQWFYTKKVYLSFLRIRVTQQSCCSPWRYSVMFSTISFSVMESLIQAFPAPAWRWDALPPVFIGWSDLSSRVSRLCAWSVVHSAQNPAGMLAYWRVVYPPRPLSNSTVSFNLSPTR